MLRLLLTIPLLVVLVIFALSNRASVTLSFLGYETAMPLSIAVLLAAGVFFVLGAVVVWIGELRQRRRARRAEQRVAVLEEQIASLRVVPVSRTLPLGVASGVPLGTLPPS